MVASVRAHRGRGKRNGAPDGTRARSYPYAWRRGILERGDGGNRLALSGNRKRESNFDEHVELIGSLIFVV